MMTDTRNPRGRVKDTAQHRGHSIEIPEGNIIHLCMTAHKVWHMIFVWTFGEHVYGSKIKTLPLVIA